MGEGHGDYQHPSYHHALASPGAQQSCLILGLYWAYIGIMKNKMEATVTGSHRISGLGLAAYAFF